MRSLEQEAFETMVDLEQQVLALKSELADLKHRIRTLTREASDIVNLTEEVA